MQVQSLGQKNPLEEGMATHSSILAPRIPMNRGQASHRVVKSWLQMKQLSTQHILALIP